MLNIPSLFSQKMRSYIYSKPPSVVPLELIHWSPMDFAALNSESNQVTTLLFISRKKEVCIVYKPMPIKNVESKLLGIIGNLYDEGNTPAIVKFDDDEIGSCFAIQKFDDIAKEFRPEIHITTNMVKETDWEQATTNIAIIAIPTLAPLLFGKEIESTIFDEKFAEEMQKISSKHGFWAKTMSNVLKQKETENDTDTIAGRVMSSRASSRQCNPACAATNGIHELTIATSGPFDETSVVGKNHDNKQGKVRLFFYRNPMPMHMDINNDNKEPEIQIPFQSANAPTKGNPTTMTAHSTTIPAATAAIPATGFPPKEFYAQLIKAMKNFQACGISGP
jgi:hypothetical protein